MSVIDFSGKDKSGSAKPPRRLSIPAKAPATSRPKLGGNITPISETRTGRSALSQGRSKTPISEISKTTKFNLLTSASYWLNQIKLSETAAKHSISLGFFKLALEAGCEVLHKSNNQYRQIHTHMYMTCHIFSGHIIIFISLEFKCIVPLAIMSSSPFFSNLSSVEKLLHDINYSSRDR